MSGDSARGVEVLRRSVADVVSDALWAELSDSYDCTRVWSAWSYGTMGEDDFEPVHNRIDQITQSIVAAIRRFEDAAEADNKENGRE